jgi:outer membrane protein TolC
MESVLTLGALVEEALQRNPEILAASRDAEMMKARIPQAGALTDPILGYGVMNEGAPVPFQTLGEAGFSEVYVGIAQDIPYPGKRRLREEVAREEAEVGRWSVESAKRRVVAQVKEAFFELYSTRAAEEIVRANIELLANLERAAEGRFEVGQVSQQDVLEAQTELSRLEERLTLLQERGGIVESLLARLLYREAHGPLGRPEGIQPVELGYSLEQLWKMAEEASPDLAEQRQRVTARESTVALARKETLPDFGVNFVYHNRGGLDPYYTFGGTLTLPLYSDRKQKKAIEEAGEGLSEARYGLDATGARVRYEVEDAYLRAKTAERLIRLYDEGILRQARLSLDSAAAQYQVGRIDFATLLSSWTRLLDYDLAYHEQLAAQQTALARLEYHVGVALTSPGGVAVEASVSPRKEKLHERES